jgi:hypothetical protein
VARPNYSYAKRQRELAKKKKQEDKRLKKLESHLHPNDNPEGFEEGELSDDEEEGEDEEVTTEAPETQKNDIN